MSKDKNFQCALIFIYRVFIYHVFSSMDSVSSWPGASFQNKSYWDSSALIWILFEPFGTCAQFICSNRYMSMVPIMWSFFCILQQILCNGLTRVTFIFLAVMCKVAVAWCHLHVLTYLYRHTYIDISSRWTVNLLGKTACLERVFVTCFFFFQNRALLARPLKTDPMETVALCFGYRNHRVFELQLSSRADEQANCENWLDEEGNSIEQSYCLI
jgi:hypothetical protein